MRFLKIFFCCITLLWNFILIAQNFETKFELSKGTKTATYQETIDFYKALANHFQEIDMQEFGMTDAGKPLHIITYNPDKEFKFENIRRNKRVLLINNGIHPGESDGIDATMMLFRDLVQGKTPSPKNTVIATIPIYNIGGSFARNSTSRTNQNGPESYGFRGNARNYDLNRDFIKADTKNAQTFAKIFHTLQPDVFIDNHVSNGADYQYTLTHLFTQHNKLGGDLGTFMHQTIMPDLEKKLAIKQWDITPYVNVFNKVPEKGFSQFIDYPRYSTGYTTLWNTLGMMVETHMLKPYQQRVLGTYALMESMVEITDAYADEIAVLRKEAFAKNIVQKTYPLSWKIDTSKSSTLSFKGFEGNRQTSDITGKKRLKYDRTKPFEKEVKYQNYFIPNIEITIPKAYIIPQGWWNVIEHLKMNQIAMTSLKKDTVIAVESYKILNYKTAKTAYEGHFNHSNTKVQKSVTQQHFKAGDYMVLTQQNGIRYLLETLEPEAVDSFFNWNFFDTILQQKEHFSPYVWEDKAKELLDKNTELKTEFEAKKQNDPTFANNWYAQLDWLHKKSAHYEKVHLQYPVYRLNYN